MTDAPSWDPRLTAWLDRVEVAWVDAGLNLVDRGELRSRLVQDLAQAVQQGAPVAELVAADPTLVRRRRGRSVRRHRGAGSYRRDCS